MQEREFRSRCGREAGDAAQAAIPHVCGRAQSGCRPRHCLDLVLVYPWLGCGGKGADSVIDFVNAPNTAGMGDLPCCARGET